MFASCFTIHVLFAYPLYLYQTKKEVTGLVFSGSFLSSLPFWLKSLCMQGRLLTVWSPFRPSWGRMMVNCWSCSREYWKFKRKLSVLTVRKSWKHLKKLYITWRRWGGNMRDSLWKEDYQSSERNLSKWFNIKDPTRPHVWHVIIFMLLTVQIIVVAR